MKLSNGHYVRCEFCGGYEIDLGDSLYICMDCGLVHGQINSKSNNEKFIKKSPCQKFCDRRVVGCHDWCDEYRSFTEWKELERNKNKYRYDINNYVFEEIEKNKKKYRR